MKSRAYALCLAGVLLVSIGAANLALKRTGVPGHLISDKAVITRKISVEEGRQPIRASFALTNKGETTVKIIRMISSCSCTEATVAPEIVPPGAVSVVRLEAHAAAVGDVDAVVSIQTDSTLTKVIPLQLRVQTVREVPFMHSAGGELVFNGHYAVGDVRKIYVTTIEATRDGTEKPNLSVNLPFCTIGEPTVSREEMPASDEVGLGKSRLYKCLYIYELTLSGLPPDDGGFSGQVRIVDPWDWDHLLTEIVQGDPATLIRAEPAELTFRFDNQLSRYQPIRCSVLSNRDLSAALVADSSKVPLEITIDEKSSTPRRKVFEVKPIAAAPPVQAEDQASMVVVIDGATSDRLLTIPTTVKAGKK